jgi:molybdopterin-guanine dinucleotide biosynthesis protein B
MVERELNVDSIVATYFTDEDLVLTEGYKSGSKEKIEICRKELKSEPLCNQADRLVAVPLFELEDISGVADFIEERFLKKTAEANVVLRLDGKKVPMKSFVKDFVLGGILGMISNLRGYGDPSQVDISIRLKKD